jgi:cell division inhibitor SulA
MTKPLERAFKEAAKLPKKEQDTLARALLDELSSEQRWDELFTGSQDLLEQLADEALETHRAGRTKELDPDKL